MVKRVLGGVTQAKQFYAKKFKTSDKRARKEQEARDAGVTCFRCGGKHPARPCARSGCKHRLCGLDEEESCGIVCGDCGESFCSQCIVERQYDEDGEVVQGLDADGPVETEFSCSECDATAEIESMAVGPEDD